MRNYIKSEWYRIFHGKEVYIMTAILSGLVLLMNLINAFSKHMIPNFKYGTVRFSLNTLTSVPFSMVVLGCLMGALLLIDDRKNGVLKTVISYGISRREILISKCIIGFFSALIVMLVVLAVYTGSAFLLLDNPEWLPLREMLSAIGASLPSAAASLVCTLVLGSLLQKDMHIVIWWFVIYYGIPLITFLLGLKVNLFEKIASWMPYHFLRIEVAVSMNSYQCLWDTPEGLARCLIAGVLGIVVFLSFGIWKFGKQEF